MNEQMNKASGSPGGLTPSSDPRIQAMISQAEAKKSKG